MKKTIITSIALSLCALITVFCFTACGGSSSSSSSDSSASAAETTEAAKSALVGTWESTDAPGTYYTFNEDGTGFVKGAGYSTDFTYVDKDSKVEFTYTGASAAQGNDYTIEGDTLTLAGEDGVTLTYKKTDNVQKPTEKTAVPQPDSALLGTWKGTDEGEGGSGIVTYNADGTGTVKTEAYETTFTFEDDGSSVTMYIANAEPQTSTYTLEDGKLTMTASDGTVTNFEKK